MEQEINRRNYHRFQVRAGAIAALNDTKLGTITDISRAGLAFRYIDFGYEEEEELKELQEVSIVNDAGFALHNVPCTVIKDDYSLPEYPFSSLRMNKCRLQFCRRLLSSWSRKPGHPHSHPLNPSRVRRLCHKSANGSRP